MTAVKKLTKFLLSGIVILAAIGVLGWKYWHYVTNPWTRPSQQVGWRFFFEPGSDGVSGPPD